MLLADGVASSVSLAVDHDVKVLVQRDQPLEDEKQLYHSQNFNNTHTHFHRLITVGIQVTDTPTLSVFLVLA